MTVYVKTSLDSVAAGATEPLPANSDSKGANMRQPGGREGEPDSTQLDWDELRRRSVEPGGFGKDRVKLWPRLLHALPKASTKSTEAETTEELPPHPDEHQISLDTERSFVLYPVVEDIDERVKLQQELNDLLVSIFRKRPKLRYFQGYHDIITVLFLTLPPELQFICAEKLSLHRVRDSMGQGLEPVLGLLQVMKKLLRLADPSYANVLESTSPLPYHALSNLLTLFSHDMPTLPLIQHVLDFLFCRPPIIIVYLATAIVLARKEEVERLEVEGEEGMVHSLLSSLPDVSDTLEEPESIMDTEPNGAETQDEGTDISVETSSQSPATPDMTLFSETSTEAPELASPTTVVGELEDLDSPLETRNKPLSSVLNQDGVTSEKTSHLPDRVFEIDQVAQTGADQASSTPSVSISHAQEPPVDDGDIEPSRAEDLLHSADSDIFIPGSQYEDVQPDSTSDSGSEYQSHLPHTRRPPKISLSSLLQKADELHEIYPPTSQSLKLSSTMGPQSVIYTWNEIPTKLPSDSTAEAMVSHPELIVYPLVLEDEDEDGAAVSSSSQTSDEGKDGVRSKEKWSGKEKFGKRSRRRKSIFYRSPFGHMERKTLVAGAVVVLGIALAVGAHQHGAFKSSGLYGLKFGTGGAGGWFFRHQSQYHQSVTGSGGGGGSMSGSVKGLKNIFGSLHHRH